MSHPTPPEELQYRKVLGQRLSTTRQRQHPRVSQRRLADAAGLSFTRLRMFEYGVARPTPEELARLIAALPDFGAALHGDAPTPPAPPPALAPAIGRDQLDHLDDVLRVPQVAQYCHVGTGTIYALIASGQLGSCRFGRYLRIPKDALRAYLAGGAR